jgi:hypothetical protein
MIFLVAALLALPGHSRSEGRSSFAVDEEGRVSVQITVADADLPELCNADFSVRDRRELEEQKLGACLARDLPLLVRVKGDGKACKLAYDRFTENKGVVVIEASGTCPSLPHELVIDWGLFQGGALDHVSVAKIEQPFADPKLVMLSKRNAHVVIDVKRPLLPWILAAVFAVATFAASIVIFVRRRSGGQAPAPR